MNFSATPSKRRPKSRKRGRENDARCHHFTPTGRRCRLARLRPLAFCRLHAGEDRDYVAESLARNVRRCTPRTLLRARRKLARYIREGRLDARNFPVLNYICDVLLHSVRLQAKAAARISKARNQTPQPIALVREEPEIF